MNTWMKAKTVEWDSRRFMSDKWFMKQDMWGPQSWHAINGAAMYMASKESIMN